MHVRAGGVAHSVAADRDSQRGTRGGQDGGRSWALGNSLQVAFDRWHEWALRQRDFTIDGKPGITEEEYEAVARRFASLGIMSSERGASAR